MRKPTQVSKVLYWLNNIGPITNQDAVVELKIMDLASVIRLLRKEYTIESEWKKSENSRYVEYKLVGKKH